MDYLQRFIDAYLTGDSLFRFVYNPETDELFLEDELQESDNGKFLYVPFKNAQQLYAEMSYFADEQSGEVGATLQQALLAPSPIKKFEQTVQETPVATLWQARKEAYAKQHILEWLAANRLR